MTKRNSDSKRLPFGVDSEVDTILLTSHAGVPWLVELFRASGAADAVTPGVGSSPEVFGVGAGENFGAELRLAGNLGRWQGLAECGGARYDDAADRGEEKMKRREAPFLCIPGRARGLAWADALSRGSVLAGTLILSTIFRKGLNLLQGEESRS